MPELIDFDLERCPASEKLLDNQNPESDFPIQWTSFCQDCKQLITLNRKRWNEHSRLKSTSPQARLL